MKVGLQANLSDPHLDANQNKNQRQLSISLAAIADIQDRGLPLNLCLTIDRSGSMAGNALNTVKEAALKIIEKLKPGDRLSVVAFDHRADVIVPNQLAENLDRIKERIQKLTADGGTDIDGGLKMSIQEIAVGKPNSVSQIFLLTDGENEHGDNARCLKLAQLASEYNITIHTLGFGANWNQDVLEKIADSAGGVLAYIERSERVLQEFEKLFDRARSVGLTNARLILELMPQVRLAEFKPIAQVTPETIELPIQQEGNFIAVRLGDLSVDREKIVLVNLYINNFPLGEHSLVRLQVRYDDPATSEEDLSSKSFFVNAQFQETYQPQPDRQVQNSVLALAKYRQTQLAEAKLKQGDTLGAATLLQTAAKTALQLGDEAGATVLQSSATRLQAGEELSEGERKKTRIASKTILRD
ncbi:MAG: vWA domain-containing protein [Xenococcaceae cyanobacterium]